VAQAKGGVDFAQLAASYSSAPEALQGGDLGWRTAERMPNVFLEAVKDLKPGQIGPIIRSPIGFHILKLVGRRTAASSKLSTGPWTRPMPGTSCFGSRTPCRKRRSSGVWQIYVSA